MKLLGIILRNSRPVVALAGWALGCVAVHGDSPGLGANPYSGISPRNVFGLKPEPRPEMPAPVVRASPPITLNGIATVVLRKQAFLSYTAPPAPGESSRFVSMVLSVGEREGEIEVLEIDEKAGTVKVNAFGTVTLLTFDRNGPKQAGPAAVPTELLNRVQPHKLRLPAQVPDAAEVKRTPEEDAIMTEVDRERHRGDANYPPLPPTPLTSPEDLERIMKPK